jgi:histone deacetylase 1/2
MAIRGQLQDLKKLDSTITNYFNKAQGLADTLTSIGEPLRPQEFIGYVLAGLDEDYDSVHAAISNRTTPITIRELYAQLLATEQRIEARKSDLHGGRDFHSANATGYSKGGKVPYRPSNDVRSDPRQQPRPGFTNKPPAGPPFHTGGGFPSRGGRGGGGYNTGGRSRHGDERGDRGGRPEDANRPICQICDKVGHIASRCFKRFKTDYLGVDNDGRYIDRQVANATTSHGQTTAYNVDAGWYMDTGATDHLTNRLDKLTMKEEYNGSDQVHAANGTGMHIYHIGHSSLSTPSSKPLHLRGVLHVPSVTRSLLSVRRFTIDNKVFIEFHPKKNLVKDRYTRFILLSGRCHGGLYRLDENLLPNTSSVE